ncbi:MAG: hypothetical protein BroJett040_22260 [Oligoflexia bacterium]|nr:MAG: hypothetical protein BroJett040_22260 [Oligoflexia bacterium]
MKSILITLSLILTASASFAKDDCTKEPKEKWMSEADFKKRVEAEGYTIKKFKQPGTCYEIYGTDKTGKKVEIYFNPVDFSIVKQK